MCYRISLNTGVKEIAKRFKAVIDKPDSIEFEEEINGFAFPTSPIITNINPAVIATDFHWGLIPSWSKDDSIRKNTLNARIETLEEKPAFKDAVINRCLIIATGYYEWHWNDDNGKSKVKYKIHSSEQEIFTFAGIYAIWRNSQNGDVVKTFSMITTEANETMAYIHNVKKRMPLMLKKEDEAKWLNSKVSYTEFSFPEYNPGLVAFPT